VTSLQEPESRALLGTDALKDARFTSDLARLWGEAYRHSSVPAQRDNPLYAVEQQVEREHRLRSELVRESAVVALLIQGRELVGFFWGLSVVDLQLSDAAKAADVSRFTRARERVAYLSMLGVHPSYGRRGYGQRLTRALCSAFAERGLVEAVARTINQGALDKIYAPLGFEVYTRYPDPRHGNAARFIFGTPLPLR
jgi:ribosomal protein S18 acetylase RimI-like enzyme